MQPCANQSSSLCFFTPISISTSLGTVCTGRGVAHNAILSLFLIHMQKSYGVFKFIFIFFILNNQPSYFISPRKDYIYNIKCLQPSAIEVSVNDLNRAHPCKSHVPDVWVKNKFFVQTFSQVEQINTQRKQVEKIVELFFLSTFPLSWVLICIYKLSHFHLLERSDFEFGFCTAYAAE